MKQEDFKNLSEGDIVRSDIVRSATSGIAYVVTGNYGGRITAVRTVDLTNPCEWELVVKADYEIKPKETEKQKSTKVFQGHLILMGVQVQACVATSSRKKLSEITGLSTHHLSRYWSMTGNKDQINAALTDEGTIFVSRIGRDNYVPINKFTRGES